MTFTKCRLVFLCALLVSGCAWQRIPLPPDLVAEAPIPLRVGVLLGDSQPTGIYGPGVVTTWKEMRLFDTVVFPYREGDPIDVVLRLSIDGGWKASGFGAGFIVGLTLGLAGPAVGPSMTGSHTAIVVLTNSGDEIGRYSVQTSSTVEWGLTADTNEVARKADELQRRRVAVELAGKIRSDRAALLSRAGK